MYAFDKKAIKQMNCERVSYRVVQQIEMADKGRKD